MGRLVVVATRPRDLASPSPPAGSPSELCGEAGCPADPGAHVRRSKLNLAIQTPRGQEREQARAGL